MAVPRLAPRDPFFLLDPDRLATTPRKASSIAGASRYGVTVAAEHLQPVDLVVAGSVAVDEQGRRLGKGGGFSDLEFAIAAELGLIGPETVVATTVHETQIVQRDRIPLAPHDVKLDLIVTPTRVIRCRSRKGRAASIQWDELTDEKIAAIPVLGHLRSKLTDR
jgi:5-formyltetrahydrofolate cyclo-ligase